MIGKLIALIFLLAFATFLIPFFFMGFALMWEFLVYPFWKEVYDWVRGSGGKANDAE